MSHPIIKAPELKALFIDYLLSTEEQIIIGNEITYGIKKRRLDILVINDFLHCYEIKSESDGLDKLEQQYNDYKSIFDFVTIVAHEKHLATVKNKFRKTKVGIIGFDGYSFHSIKKHEIFKTKNKQEILHSIPLAYLKTIFRNNSSCVRLDLKVSSDTIYKEYKKYLKIILSPRFGNFIKERGINTHSDDLSLLSIISNNSII